MPVVFYNRLLALGRMQQTTVGKQAGIVLKKKPEGETVCE
jgi:hypothetical protein